MRNSPLLEIKNLSKVYPNHEALTDVSFTVQEGEFICIIGPNGAGKSTLLRCTNGLIPVTQGSVRFLNTDVTCLNDDQKLAVLLKIGFIFQEFNLIGRLTALHNVLLGRLGYISTIHALLGYFGREHREKALECLERVKMLHRATYRANNLSGGEKQRVAIARALAQEPWLLLADEPVASLDPEHSWNVMRDLQTTAKELGVSTLVTLHDIEMAKHFADRILGIAKGHILFDGPPQSLTDSLLQEIYCSDTPVTWSRRKQFSSGVK